MRLRFGAALGVAVAGLLAVPVTGVSTALASTPKTPVTAIAVACPIVQVVSPGQTPVTAPVPPRQVRFNGKLPLPCCGGVAVASPAPPRHVRVVRRLPAPCCGPFLFPLRAKQVKANQIIHAKLRKGARYALTVAAGCRPLTFDMASGSSVITEVHGPRLAAHELLFYHGRLYTIASVSGDTFTVDYRGGLFVNNGASITDGRAYVLPGVRVFLAPAPAPAP